MSTPWQTRGALAILVLLGAWPLLHMPLSKRLGFSPWKLGGFGMFSAGGDWMDDAVRVDVVLVPDPAVEVRHTDLATLLQELPAIADGEAADVLQLAATGFSRRTLSFATPAAEEVFSKESENVMLWPRPAYLAALAQAAIDGAHLPPETAVIVTRRKSRLDLARGSHHVEACAFVVTLGTHGSARDVASRGCLASDAIAQQAQSAL